MRVGWVLAAVLIVLTVGLVLRSGSPPVDPVDRGAGEEDRAAGTNRGTVVSQPPPPAERFSPEESHFDNAALGTSMPSSERREHFHPVALEIWEEGKRSGTSASEDIQIVQDILSLYRDQFTRNPVAADNQMVTEALTGNNTSRTVFLPKEDPRINARGELMDPWGTPYFFHPLSGSEMEIFSAGPDREFNTVDDVHQSERGEFPLTDRAATLGQDEEPEAALFE